MRVIIVLIAFLFFFAGAKSVSAVTVTISDYPGTLTDESFTISASVSGATSGTNYLRIDLFEDGTTNYFGETYNGSDWYGGSTYSQYAPITIQSGVTWSGSVQGRIGSPTGTQYDGSGTYKIRLRRYTSGGGYTSTEANNSAVVISIALPTSTPTPTVTPTPSPTSSPAPTSAPTKTPTLAPTRTPPPSPSLVPSLSLAPTIEESAPAGVLGGSDDASASEVAGESRSNLPQILMGIGVILLSACGILVFQNYKRSKNDNPEL